MCVFNGLAFMCFLVNENYIFWWKLYRNWLTSTSYCQSTLTSFYSTYLNTTKYIWRCAIDCQTRLMMDCKALSVQFWNVEMRWYWRNSKGFTPIIEIPNFMTTLDNDNIGLLVVKIAHITYITIQHVSVQLLITVV